MGSPNPIVLAYGSRLDIQGDGFISGELTVGSMGGAPTFTGDVTFSGALIQFTNAAAVISAPNGTFEAYNFDVPAAGQMNIGGSVGTSPIVIGSGSGAVSLQGIIQSQGRQLALVHETAAFTMNAYADEVALVDASGAAVVITLPSATGLNGTVFTVKKIDSTANAVTVTPAATQTIDGAASIAITTQYEAVTVIAYAGNWYVIYQVATTIL